LRADERYIKLDSNERYYETARLIKQMKQEHMKQTRDTLTAELREAESNGDDARAMQLLVQLNELTKEIARGKR